MLLMAFMWLTQIPWIVGGTNPVTGVELGKAEGTMAKTTKLSLSADDVGKAE